MDEWRSHRRPTPEIAAETTVPMSSNELHNFSMEQVHVAWLAAGARGDVDSMRRLREQHPQWLDLQRLVGAAAVAATPDLARQLRQQFCGWNGFHLSTIGASALHTATWEGSLGIVELLLEAGQDPDTPDERGLTPIMVALLRYNVVVMRCVFRNGQAVRRNVVVDCRGEDSDLLRYIMDVIKLMLRFGADVNTRNQDGYSALHYAANGDALDVAKFLLDTGADMNTQDQNGKTALHHCIHEGSLLMANLLISRGADIDWKDDTGETPVTLCLRRRSMNMLQIILNHHHMVATAQRRDFATNVLLSAVDYEVGEAVHLIVEGGYSSVTVSNAAGETALHRAILKRNPQLMELLMDLDPAGESLTATTAMGETPTHYAARHGSVSVVETLLRRLTGVFGDLGELDEVTNPLNVTNNAGETCLHVAATTEANTRHGLGDRDAIVEILQRHNARLFPRDCIVLRSSSAEMVLLHEHVRRGMALWVREARDQSHEIDDDHEEDDGGDEGRISDVLLTELCFEWVASVAVLPSSSRRTNWTGALLVVISAGYAYEFVPLLLELPLVESAVAGVLDRLERFARVRQGHLVLLQLHAELSAAVGGRGDLING